MEQSKSSYSRIHSSSNPDLIKKINLSSVIRSLTILVIGAILFLIAWRLDDTTSSINMLFLTLGTICLLWSIYRFFWQSKYWIYLPTGSSTKEGSCFFDNEYLHDMIKIFDKENSKHENIIKKQIDLKNRADIRMDYMLSKDHKFAAVQIFKYIPYTYEPVSDIYYLTGVEADNFANCLINRKF